jgi:hypothetical protein
VGRPGAPIAAGIVVGSAVSSRHAAQAAQQQQQSMQQQAQLDQAKAETAAAQQQAMAAQQQPTIVYVQPTHAESQPAYASPQPAAYASPQPAAYAPPPAQAPPSPINNALPQEYLQLTSAHLVDEGNPINQQHHILSVPAGATVTLVRGNLQCGLDTPYQNYIEVEYNGRVGKISRMIVHPASFEVPPPIM